MKTETTSSHCSQIVYRRGAAGQLAPVVRGTRIRVQTLVLAERQWQWSPAQIAAEYDLPETQVSDALAFYQAHRAEIDAEIDAEVEMEKAYA